MKRRIIYALTIAAAVAALGGEASAQSFYFGEETKGATVSSNSSDLNVRIRLQPRFDYGNIIKSKDNNSYETEGDLYMRRIRLEMTGSLLVKTLKYAFVLEADKWEKAGNTNKVGVQYANLEWEATDNLSFLAGKEKLPYSRVSLTSSSKQLLVERPVSTEDAKKVFGLSTSENPYYQPKFGVKGKFLDGMVAFEAAVADGWQNGETIQTGKTVFQASPLYVGRVEVAPPGWVEKKKSDAHLGEGQHLTLGFNVANQSNIEYKENGYSEDRTLWGVDISGHYKGLTGQVEYNEWEIDSEDPSVADKKPRGWYAQAGYFIDGLAIEPVVRYESYDQDSLSANKKEENTTIGANWYGMGHSLKVGVNWVHTKYETAATGNLANDDKKDIVQVQGQMYF